MQKEGDSRDEQQLCSIAKQLWGGKDNSFKQRLAPLRNSEYWRQMGIETSRTSSQSLLRSSDFSLSKNMGFRLFLLIPVYALNCYQSELRWKRHAM